MIRRCLSLATLMLGLGVFASTASAQTFTGPIPGPTVPNTWGTPNPGQSCNGTATTRAYTAFTFTIPGGTGNYNFTATRASGTGVALHVFQGSFDPTFACLNFWTNGAYSNTNSATLSTALTTYASTFILVISGANASDVANFTLSVTGPTTATAVCTDSTLSPTSISGVAANGSTTPVTYTPAFGCQAWSSSGVPAWITGVPASGNGPTTFNLTVGMNTGGARNANLTIGGKSLFVSQVAQTCTYALSSASANVGAGSSPASTNLTTTPTCPWTATTATPWITVNSPSGTGSATVSLTVGANNGPTRSGTVTIGGQTFTVNQANGCTYTVTPSTVAIGAAGQNGAGVSVAASNPACTWTAASNSPFLTAVSPTNGTGSSAVSFNVAANTSVARSGTLTVAGQTVTVNQASGCAYALSTNVFNTAQGATMATVNVTTTAGCAWNANPNVAWLYGLSTTSATGSGSVTFSVDANSGPVRSGTLTVAGQTVTVNQANGCTYSVLPTVLNVGSASVAGASVTVSTDPACPWSASSGSAFLTNVNASTAAGSGTVAFDVAANVNPARSGSLTVAGQSVTVNQADGCTFVLSGAGTTIGAGGAVNQTVDLTTGPSCAWTTASSSAFVSGASPASGTGSATISYTVAANVGPARSATLTVAGQSYLVAQDEGCTYAISATPSTGATASGVTVVFVNTSDSACGFSIASDAGFAPLSFGSQSGDQTYVVAYEANDGDARVATFTVTGQYGEVATATFSQASGCTYSVTPTTGSVSAAGEIGRSVTLTASNANCPFTAVANDAFLANVAPTSGTGSTTVTFDVDPNTSVARSGTLTIAGTTVTIDQADGCTYTLTPNSATLSAAGQNGVAVDIATDGACAWTAVPGAAFVGNVTPASGTGPATITFDVAANAGPARAASLDVGGSVVDISQAEGCDFTITANPAMISSSAAMVSVDVVATDAACVFDVASDAAFAPLSAAAASGTQSFMVSVAENAGIARTATFTLTGANAEVATATLDQALVAAPTITQDPQSVTVTEGDAILLTVGVTGAGLSYQWRLGGMDLPLETNPTLSIPASAIDDAGSYDVVVTNLGGTATSGTATVVVNAIVVDAGVDGGTATDAGIDVDSSVVDTDAGGDASVAADAGGDATTGGDAATGGDAGTTPPTGEAGCSCKVAGDAETSPAAWLANFAIGLAIVLRARRRR